MLSAQLGVLSRSLFDSLCAATAARCACVPICVPEPGGGCGTAWLLFAFAPCKLVAPALSVGCIWLQHGVAELQDSSRGHGDCVGGLLGASKCF